MKTKNKTVLFIIIIASALSILIFVGKNQQGVNIKSPKNENIIFTKRDFAIKDAQANPEKLKKVIVNKETYLMTQYPEEKFQENNSGWRPAGIIFFKLENNQIKLFWESSEDISNGGSFRFQDIDNDGIAELIWEGDGGVTGENNSIYVYKFNGSGFKLITPAETAEVVNLKGEKIKHISTILGGDSDLTYMKDIDGDKIQEIVVGYREGNIINRQIYKFNGQEYKLWKEEKVNP